MLGAILGDLTGTPLRGRPSSLNVSLFSPTSAITADTVNMLAVAEALMTGAPLEANCRLWQVRQGVTEPGSLVRVAAAGWLACSLDEAQLLGRAAGRGSERRYRELLGAEALAGTLWLARQGLSADQIKEEVSTRYRYQFGDTLEEHAVKSAMSGDAEDAVGLAIDCALQSRSVEEAVRKVLEFRSNLAGTAAMAGSIAEARFGVTKEVAGRILDRTPQVLHRTIAAVYGRAGTPMWTESGHHCHRQDVIASEASPQIDEVQSASGWFARFKTRISA